MAVLAAVLMGACGDDGESAAPTTTSTSLSQVQLDEQKAERAVLSAADLSGYTEDAPDPDEEDVAAAEECLEQNALLIRLGDDDDPRGAGSPDFTRDVHTVSSSVTFAETEDEARAALAVMDRQNVVTCLGDALAAELRGTPGFTDVRVTSSKLPAINAGDQNVGHRLVVRAGAAGQSITVNVEFTFMRAGRGVAVFQAVSETTTFPASDRSRLAGLVAGRMAA